MHVVSETRVARKRHRCQCCGGLVLPGTPHLVETGLDHGTVWRQRFCLPCHAVADASQSSVHDEDFWPDSAALWELREELRHSSDPILADLTSDDAWPNHPLPDELCARIRTAVREVWG